MVDGQEHFIMYNGDFTSHLCIFSFFKLFIFVMYLYF